MGCWQMVHWAEELLGAKRGNKTHQIILILMARGVEIKNRERLSPQRGARIYHWTYSPKVECGEDHHLCQL